MIPSVLILVGLPGCGKTTYLNELRRGGWSAFDDFKAGAIDNSSEFQKSRHFLDLLAKLRTGCRSVVADIDFCKEESRSDAEKILSVAAPEAQIHWCFFAHDEVSCQKNVRRRNRDSIEADLRELRKYSKVYSIPEGAKTRSVVCEASSHIGTPGNQSLT